LVPGKPGGQAENAALQDTVRMAHASTMASILFSKDAEAWRFDELIAAVPTTQPGKPANEGEPAENPPQPGAKGVIDVGTGWTVQDRLTAKSEKDPRRETFRKVYSVHLRAGQTYYMDMRSNDLTPYLRLESAAGAKLDSATGANARIIFHAQN